MRYALSPKWTLIYLLLIGVLADIAYGVLEYNNMGALRLSLLYRMTILAAFLVILIKRNDFHSWVVKSIILLWLVSMSVWVVTYGTTPLVININFFLRAIFVMAIAFILFRALESAHHDGYDISEKVFLGVIAYGVIASCSILFSFFTGIGRLTYGEWAFGIKSFFTGGNDIGLTMLVSLVFCWRAFWIKDSLVNLGLIMLISVAIAMIGSRAALGGVVGVTAVFTVAFLLFRRSDSIRTSFYKIVVGAGVIGISTFVFNYVSENFEELAFQVEKVTELLEGLSPRAKLEEIGNEVLEQRSAIHDMFGQGTRFFFEVHDLYYTRFPARIGLETEGYKAIEQDVMDIYGLYGWLLGGVFLFYHLCFWFISVRGFLRHRNILYFSCAIAISMYIFHGALAGHALVTSQVGTVIGAVYAFLWFKMKYPDEEVQV